MHCFLPPGSSTPPRASTPAPTPQLSSATVPIPRNATNATNSTLVLAVNNMTIGDTMSLIANGSVYALGTALAGELGAPVADVCFSYAPQLSLRLDQTLEFLSST